MKIKTFLVYISSILSASALTFFPVAHAKQISLYDQPASNAKVVDSADLSAGIIPIYSLPSNSEWIKVADPRNGHVGWVKANELKATQVSSNNITVTQKIIRSNNQPGTYHVIQFGNGPNLTDAQMKEYIQQIHAEQQAMQQSFQSIFKEMNNLFQHEWRMWSAYDGFPLIVSIPNTAQPKRAVPKKPLEVQPSPTNTATTKPTK